MCPSVMSEDEKMWRRREDARALARANEIKADKARYKEAQIGAKEILDEKEKELNSLKSVAKGYSRHSNKATVSKEIPTDFTK